MAGGRELEGRKWRKKKDIFIKVGYPINYWYARSFAGDLESACFFVGFRLPRYLYLHIFHIYLHLYS